MTQEEIQTLLDQASSLYNDGQYDDAIALWNQVLASEPQNARAREGIKMANLLLSDWVQPATPQSAPPVATTDPTLPLDAGFVDEQLALARHYTMLGDAVEAEAACRRVLEVDAANQVAAEILASLTAGPGAAPDPPLEPALEPLTAPGPQATVAPPGEADLALEPLALELAEEVGEPPWDSPPAARAEEGPDGRIASLLEEGDRFEQAGRFQDAIDTWSRIFVLQDAHPEAELRMDRARRALEQQARRMEEHLARGEELAAAGRIPEALDAFRRVLEIRSEHAEARRRIAEMEARLAAGPIPPPAPPTEVRQPPPSSEPRLDDEPRQSRLPTPPPMPARRARGKRPAGGMSGSPVRLVAAGLVAVAVIATVGYFAWQTFFPPRPVADLPAADVTPGNQSPGTAVAPPAEAAPAAPLSVQEVTPATPPPSVPVEVAPTPTKTDAREVLRLGIARFGAGEFEEAKRHFDEVLRSDPSHFEATEWATKTQAEIDKRQRYAAEITSVRQAFTQRDYRGALYKLYRVETPTAADRKQVERWIADCWYDWGVESLQGGRLEDAQKNFQEARDARADDREAAQHLEVLARYRGRPVDAALQAYSARLTLRPLG